MHGNVSLIYNVIYCTEKRCPDLSKIPNIELPDTYSNVYGSTVVVTCSDNYKMKDGYDNITASCLADKSWSEMIDEHVCSGKCG